MCQPVDVCWVVNILQSVARACFEVPFHISQRRTGIGGGKVTALANVTGGMGACCALCHGDYHDECSGWVYGQTGVVTVAGRYPEHNCAIMATNGRPNTVAGHISGINRNPPPPPAPKPVGKACRADIDCDPLSSSEWRCLGAKAAPSPANNCHLPGPGEA